MITEIYKDLYIPSHVFEIADKIKFKNYKVNTPAKFEVCEFCESDVMFELSRVIGIDKDKLDYVYFSCCSGAEPHTDLLDPNTFTNNTYVIPVILPKGKSTITAESDSIEVIVGGVYKFDHTKVHSMELEDIESGCVVLMVSELR